MNHLFDNFIFVSILLSPKIVIYPTTKQTTIFTFFVQWSFSAPSNNKVIPISIVRSYSRLGKYTFVSNLGFIGDSVRSVDRDRNKKNNYRAHTTRHDSCSPYDTPRHTLVSSVYRICIAPLPTGISMTTRVLQNHRISIRSQ